jgi:hypothetical protein
MAAVQGKIPQRHPHKVHYHAKDLCKSVLQALLSIFILLYYVPASLPFNQKGFKPKK